MARALARRRLASRRTDTPDIITGADSLRLYEMFMGPLRETKVWSTRSVDGVHRFLGRVWRLYEANIGADVAPSAEQLRVLHVTIKRVTGALIQLLARDLSRHLTRAPGCVVAADTEEMRFNTAIAVMMEFVNAAYKWDACPRTVLEPFALLLAPYAPHIAEELWSRLGHGTSLAYAPWPRFEERHIVQSTVRIAVQVNGKMRGTVDVAADADEETVVAAAMAAEGVSKWLTGVVVKRRIFVQGRLLNMVVAPV